MIGRLGQTVGMDQQHARPIVGDAVGHPPFGLGRFGTPRDSACRAAACPGGSTSSTCCNAGANCAENTSATRASPCGIRRIGRRRRGRDCGNGSRPVGPACPPRMRKVPMPQSLGQMHRRSADNALGCLVCAVGACRQRHVPGFRARQIGRVRTPWSRQSAAQPDHAPEDVAASGIRNCATSGRWSDASRESRLRTATLACSFRLR